MELGWVVLASVTVPMGLRNQISSRAQISVILWIKVTPSHNPYSTNTYSTVSVYVLQKYYWCSLLDCKETKPVSLKEMNPKYSLEGLMLKLKLQYFVHLMTRPDSLENILILGKMEGKKRRGR